MSARRAAVALAFAALGSGCATLKSLPGADLLDPQNAARIGQNLGTMAVSGELTKTASFDMAQEHHLGKTVAAQVLARLGGQALPPTHPASRYLRDVGTVVSLAAAELRQPDDRPAPLRGWRFIPVESPSVNAVGAPGGFVLVTTGLLRAARSEDELAAVLAHEVAHVQRGHTMQPVEAARKQEQLTSGLLAGTSDKLNAFFGAVVSAGADVVLDRGFGKRNELDADALAVRILAEAGYDPGALSAFLARLDGPAAKGGFFSRHPPPAERVAALAGVTPAPAPDLRRARLARVVASLP
ncbi:MAG TPA: M48 family metallopeptidase [Anaeromyxobacteraceae bacterium]|nr:M48 family metallopeptidase [Anaeromyxobacteraceae bacterium]